jgi:Bacteriocin-protection, YdeI or OmpD-Associated
MDAGRASPGRKWSIRRSASADPPRLDAPGGLGRLPGRAGAKSGVYSYEQRQGAKLPESLERRFRRNRSAWRFFREQPPGYQRTAAWWAISAKKEETRLRRLATLIEDSAQGRAIQPLLRKGGG